MTALRAFDTTGARFIIAIGDVEGIVSSEMIGDFRLTVGREVSEPEAEQLTAASHRLQVFDQAVGLLAHRARSARDLRVALRRRGATDDEARAALARLAELQLIDDAAFARERARSRAVSGGVSRRRLQQELARRGINATVAREAVGDVVEEVGLDEREAALAAARKRARSIAGLDASTARRRLYAFLARRGYAPGVISAVVRAVLDAADGSPSDDGAGTD